MKFIFFISKQLQRPFFEKIFLGFGIVQVAYFSLKDVGKIFLTKNFSISSCFSNQVITKHSEKHLYFWKISRKST